MPVDQFDTNFSNLSHSEFIVTLGAFADSLLAHPFFKDNWPDYLTHPTELKKLLNEYHETVVAADTDGGKKNHSERDKKRQQAHASVVFMGQYVVMRAVSQNDPTLLDVGGLKLKNGRLVRSSNKSSVVLAPTVTVKHAPDSGAVIVAYSKVASTGSYEIQISTGDPSDEGAWSTYGQFSSCRVVVTGQQPATTVHFRVRFHGTGDPGPFSQPVSIIVL